MNILLCFNDRFVPVARALIISLMCHHEKLHFFIGYTNLNEENRQGLKELVEGKCHQGDWPWDSGEFRKHAPQRSIDFVKFTPPDSLQVFGKWTVDIWTRCFIWEQLPVDRLLYLDADIIVNGNIEQFYHDDLGNNLIKACPDYVWYGTGYGSLRWLKKLRRFLDEHEDYDDSHYYCNSGVVLFNVAKMRAEGLTAQKLVEAYYSITVPLQMPDQDFINLYFDGRIKYANPYRYNCETPPLPYMKRQDFPSFSEFDLSERQYPVSEASQTPPALHGVTYDPKQIVIFHFSSGDKPNHWRYHYQFAEVFWRYQLMDPTDASKHVWARILQHTWGVVRRPIPDRPLDIFRKGKPRVRRSPKSK